MNKEMSSEEKLLQLIRQKDKSSAKQKAEARQKPLKKGKSRRGADLFKNLNRLLVLVALAGLVYVSIQYLTDKKDSVITVNYDKVLQTQPENVVVELPIPKPKPFDTYGDVLQERNIFQSPWDKPKANNKPSVDPASDLKRKVKILGIVLDDNPQVIVEDLKAKQTYFLSIGESVNGAKLMEVFSNKATFTYLDETVELFQ